MTNPISIKTPEEMFCVAQTQELRRDTLTKQAIAAINGQNWTDREMTEGEKECIELAVMFCLARTQDFRNKTEFRKVDRFTATKAEFQMASEQLSEECAVDGEFLGLPIYDMTKTPAELKTWVRILFAALNVAEKHSE